MPLKSMGSSFDHNGIYRAWYRCLKLNYKILSSLTVIKQKLIAGMLRLGDMFASVPYRPSPRAVGAKGPELSSTATERDTSVFFHNVFVY